MSLTGLFLITFLVVHVSGNMLMFKSDDGEAFNLYAQFMTTNPLIKMASYVLYIGILLHVFYALYSSGLQQRCPPGRLRRRSSGTEQ